jgi:hypothetical protein
MAARSDSGRRVAPRRADIVIALCLTVLAAGASWVGSGITAASVPAANSLWFASDSFEFREQLTVTPHEIETRRHPLSAVLLRVPVRVSQRLTGVVDSDLLVRAFLALAGAAWVTLLFAGNRLMGCRPADSALFALLALTSATGMFWLVMPDIFVFSSLTTLPAFLLIAARRSPTLARERWTTIATALSYSMTVTNVVFGGVTTVLRHPPRRAVQVIANAGWIVLALLVIQKSIYPSTAFFNVETGGDVYVTRLLWPLDPLRSFIVYSMVMPQPGIDTTWGHAVLSVQSAALATSTFAGAIATATWIAMLSIGVIALKISSAARDVKVYLLIVTAFQLLLHVVFGEETFLYSPHFLPWLLFIAALGLLSPWRRVVLTLAGVLLIASLVNNIARWQESVALAQQAARQFP